MVSRPQEVSTDSEEILHDTVNRREPLELSGRLETPHLALPLTRRLVGDLGSIVRVLFSDVDHGRHHGAARGGVGAQLVGDQSSRDTALGFQQRPKESDGCSPSPVRWHEDVQDVTVLVDRAPQILLATLDRDEHLVEMPGVSGPGANPFPDVLARMQPSDSLPPVGRGSGRPWPVAYPVPRATRRKKGLPGAWAVLFQRAVGSDPAGCASRRAQRVETAIAFRLHNALGTQNERYFVAVTPTAHSLACLRIGVFVTADAARLATGVGGSPFTGRVSHPLDGEQSFMTSPHRHSPLTSLAWSHVE